MEDLRPDKTGVVLHEFAEPDLPFLELFETYRDAADKICDRLEPARSQGFGLLIYCDGEPHTAVPPILADDNAKARWLERFWQRLRERRQMSEAVARQIRQRRGH
jgi:hypothetical protein